MVTAVGVDRPGVVAAVTGVLVELGCNLSDTQMAVLQGHASMMLVVEAPPELDAEAMKSALGQGTESLGQAVWVRRLSEARPPAPGGTRWVVSVHGADRPGVVFEVTRVLSEAGINIVDLRNRQTGRYSTLAMQVEVPTNIDGGATADHLDRLGDELGLSCSMRPVAEHP